MRFFLDANVLFSASNPESNLARLAALVLKDHEAITSDLAHEEARRNISLKRAAWADGFHDLSSRIQIVASIAFPLSVELDEKDAPILCTAIRSGCPYLVTGDKRHFGHLYDTTVEGVTIISLLRLAEIVLHGPRT